jgi:hypothetical protein
MTKTAHGVCLAPIAVVALISLLPARQLYSADQPAPGKDKAAWKTLFDGKALTGWKSTDFGGEGEVTVKDGVILMEVGNDMTGITYSRDDFPKIDYEVTLEGKKVKGSDFFCTTTFPVGDSHCSLVVGGWGGAVVGLSSIDGKDASENDTKSLQTFERDKWYRVRIRVTGERIQAWIDDKRVVNLATKGKKITIRGECDASKPFGIATWRTAGALRDIRLRSLTDEEKKAAGDKK